MGSLVYLARTKELLSLAQTMVQCDKDCNDFADLDNLRDPSTPVHV
jgi:hypothetical protein